MLMFRYDNEIIVGDRAMVGHFASFYRVHVCIVQYKHALTIILKVLGFMNFVHMC